MIGFKQSKHTGQMFLTFRPAKKLYSYTLGGKPYYPKSVNFSDLVETAIETAIDPFVEAAAVEMAKTAAETLNSIIKTAMDSYTHQTIPHSSANSKRFASGPES